MKDTLESFLLNNKIHQIAQNLANLLPPIRYSYVVCMEVYVFLGSKLNVAHFLDNFFLATSSIDY